MIDINAYFIYIKRARYGSFIGERPTTTIKLIPIVIHGTIPNAPKLCVFGEIKDL